MNTSSEHLSSLIIWFVSNRCLIFLSNLSVRWSGKRLPLCWVVTMLSLISDLAMWFFDFPIRVHSLENFSNIFFLNESSVLMWFICLPFFCVSKNPSLDSTSLPSRFTFWVCTMRILLSLEVQSPDVRSSWSIPVIGMDTLLKHLYFSGCWLNGSLIALLHFWSMVFAVTSFMKLFGLPVSAVHSMSMLFDLVFIQISLLRDASIPEGFLFITAIGFTWLTWFQLSIISWI